MNKTTQACPELVEGRSAWWRFRHSGRNAKSVCLSDYVRCAGNANSRCRSNRLIPAYRVVGFASNVFSEACSVWEVEKESHGLPIILGYSAVASNLTMKINGYSDVVDSQSPDRTISSIVKVGTGHRQLSN